MKRLELLDYGRFFAAIIVVLYHYTYSGIAHEKIQTIAHIDSVIDITKYGYLGVELFFMISGFVIFHSAKYRTPAQFAVSRALRLYPSYWFAVIFTSSFALFWGGDLMSVSLIQIITNISLLQSYFYISHVDGVYWTLVYEIEFYALVFFAIFIGLQKHLNLLFILWPYAMLGAYITGYDYLPYLGGYFYYFASGALFAMLQSNKSLKNLLPLGVVFILCVLYTIKVASLKSEAMSIDLNETTCVLIIISFFAFFAFQNTHKAQRLKLPYSKTLGALTYPVYLIHAHFGYMFISKFANESNKLFIYIVTILIVLLVSYFMHKVIEVKLGSIWKYLFMNTLYKIILILQCIPDSLRINYNKLFKRL